MGVEWWKMFLELVWILDIWICNFYWGIRKELLEWGGEDNVAFKKYI